jgi:hypothetical protein
MPQADRSAADARGDDCRWRDAIEGVKEPIADRFPRAFASGFAIVERGSYLGIGTMTALLAKTVDLAHRRAIELEEAHRKAAGASEANPASLPA